MQARGIIERLPHIELDSVMAEDGVPLIEECDNLLCDVRTLAIWGATAFCLMLVSFCLCWNCFIHWKADVATDVPMFLQNIREQQAKYKQMNLKVCCGCCVECSHDPLVAVRKFQPDANGIYVAITCSLFLLLAKYVVSASAVLGRGVTGRNGCEKKGCMVQVAPAKPDYIIERKMKEESIRMEQKLARDEEKKDKELKMKIKQTEDKLQRRRVCSFFYW